MLGNNQVRHKIAYCCTHKGFLNSWSMLSSIILQYFLSFSTETVISDDCICLLGNKHARNARSQE